MDKMSSRCSGLKFLLVSITMLMLSVPCAAQYRLDTLVYAGDSRNITDIVFLGDGFTQSELSKFVKKTKEFTDYFFKKEPWKRYRSMFNVFYVQTPSKVSGAGKTPDAPIDNFYGTTFGCAGVDRMPWPTDMDKVYEVLNSTKPDYDLVIILVNSTKYGGAGNEYYKMMCVSLESSSKETVCHEAGHSFAGLADEYWYDRKNESPNDARQINPVKWQRWVGTENVGVYPFEDTEGWYRPHENCLMRYLNREYCAVCRETIIEKIHSITKNIVSYTPSVRRNTIETDSSLTFRLNLLVPSPNTLRVEWKLDDSLVARNIDTLRLSCNDMTEGSHKLVASVEDTIQLVRVTGHSKIHLSTVTWRITNEGSSGVEALESYYDAFWAGPLPISDELTFGGMTDIAETVRMELFDLNGGRVAEGSFAPGTPCRLSTVSLGAGIYLLRVHIGDRMVYSRKLLKE